MRSTSYPGLPTREITARVRSVANTHAWAKAGVMFRQSPPIAGSQHEPGLAVTSHNNSALTTAVFENVRLRSFLSR